MPQNKTQHFFALAVVVLVVSCAFDPKTTPKGAGTGGSGMAGVEGKASAGGGGGRVGTGGAVAPGGTGGAAVTGDGGSAQDAAVAPSTAQGGAGGAGPLGAGGRPAEADGGINRDAPRFEGGTGSGGMQASGAGGKGGSGPPVCPIPPACSLGARRCGLNGGVQSCVAGTSGCSGWGAEENCAGAQKCKAAAGDAMCACPDAPSECNGKNNGSFCDAAKTTAIECKADAQGCMTSRPMPCTGGKPCEGAYPTAKCANCPPPPADCNGGLGKLCKGNTLLTCTQDGNGCVSITAMMTCAVGNPCMGNAPSAACCVPNCAGVCGGADACGGTCPNNCTGAQTCGGGGNMNVCGSCGMRLPNHPASTDLPNPASYDTRVAGAVTDKVSGLMWEHGGAGLTDGKILTTAAAYCTALRTAGFADWRLPTRIELISLVDYTTASPALNGALTSPKANYFWSSTAMSGRPGYNWIVYSPSGASSAIPVENDTLSTRCVRGASPACPGPRFSASGGWVADAQTKLVWQQTVSMGKDWDQAKAACRALGGGARLPSETEIQSIVDETTHDTAIDPIFSGTSSSDFWTSSAIFGNLGYVWVINFEFGLATSASSTLTTPVFRCVR